MKTCNAMQGIRELTIADFEGDRTSPHDPQRKVVAKGKIMVPLIIPVPRALPSLVSPLKMDSINEDQYSPFIEDALQIRVSYSETSIERNTSVAGVSNDDASFRNAVMLGRSQMKEGRYDRALQQYSKALRSKNKTIESESKTIQEEFGNVLFDIGCIHSTSGFEDRLKSLEAFHFCLDIRRICLRSDHPEVATVLYKLASIYSSLDDNQYALDLLLEAVSILLSAPTKERKRHLIEVWTAIGRVQEALGEEEESQSSFSEAEKLQLE
jgi:tetratricopeptide (TPR) repeat protein